MKITNPYGPNFTILAPGKCNAKCAFCFWDHETGKIKPDEHYLDELLETFKNLPPDFKSVSISGGEPLLSPKLEGILDVVKIAKRRCGIDRVVLTTNGTMLKEKAHLLTGVVDHLNISRHGIGTEKNYAIFKTTSVPSDEELVDAINSVSMNIDITFNCVITEDTPYSWCLQFVDYAKEMGAKAVSFRKVASDVTPTKAERMFAIEYGIDSENKCTVCRGATGRIGSMEVRWKVSVEEPSLDTNGVYELIFHPTGTLSRDWANKEQIPIYRQISFMQTDQVEEDEEEEVSYLSMAGCGGGSRC